ncbi:MAG: hypothetical protein K0S27_384 [Gammaproteobacteria bacterium]|jgi:D-alanyl-D-alanine dipeptidase|nr:hypothetical protein [Gammaproteobacteria bacterium]
MLLSRLLFVFLSVIVMTCSASPIWFKPNKWQGSQQLLLVLSPAWYSVQGTLQRYERCASNHAWCLVDKEPIPVVVGKKGMGWGVEWVQQHGMPLLEPIKKEGDGRSPAGVYSLGSAFGFSAVPRSIIPSIKWPYLALKTTSICVDDQVSSYYNQLIDTRTVAHWKGKINGEGMRAIIPQYTWGVVVNYNKDNLKGAGSCIFMHIWTNAYHGTAGCVAMEQDKIMHVLGWLDPTKKPVIALFPYRVYKTIQKEWDLPLV